MKTFDYIILIITIVGFIVGFRKGLFKQLGTLSGILVGLACCRILNVRVSQWILERGYLVNINDYVSYDYQRYVAGTIAAVCLFLIGFIGVKILFMCFHFTIESTVLKMLNRLLGALFSIFLYCFILSLFINLCQIFKTNGRVIDESSILDGKIANEICCLAPRCMGYVRLASKVWNIETDSNTHNE